MSMTLDAMPDEPPPLADPGGVPIGTTQAPPDYAPAVAAPNVQPPADLGRMSSELAEIQRQKVAANEGQYAEIQSTLARDKARMRQAYDAAGIGPNDLPTWNADEAREKFKYDPIQAFGSIGSVFAIVASSFTNRPMENAMLGAASAMNAVKAGNEQEYERAYKAWQDNTNLAIKRQGIQNQQYQNAVSLLTTDMAAGEASIKVNALKFGDKQALFLLENGMNKELIELFDKRQDMSIKLQKAMPEIALKNEEQRDLFARTSGKVPGSPEYVRAVQEHQEDWKGRKYDEDRDFSRQWHQENPDGTADEFREAYKQWTEDTSNRKGGSARVPKPEEAEINRRRDEKIASGMPAKQAYDEAVQETKRAGAIPSGNRLDDLRGMQDRITLAETTLDKLDAMLLKHNAITGLGGTFTRPIEVVGNVIGSNETDRVQFARYIAELKEILPRIITGSNARPLAAEVGNINRIAAGMAPGDTGANTMRAYAELRPVLAQIKAALAARAAPPSGAAPAVPPKTGAAPWANDPVAP